MISKRKKNKRHSFSSFSSLFFATCLFGGIIVLTLFNYRIYKRRAELSQQIRDLEDKVRALEKEKSDLQAGISQTDKESYWEEKVREQGFVKEGEKQVVVVPPESTIEKIKEGENKQGIWKQFLEKIKDFLRQ